MKALLQVLLLSLFFSLSISVAYANCCMDDGGCPESYCPDCQCTDPECIRGSNYCMSKSTCCEAFGNVGAR